MSTSSSSPAVSTTDYIACPACHEAFTAPPSPCVPMSLTCGHCVCAPCLEAVTLSAGAGEPCRCPICTSVCGNGVMNAGLVSLLEAMVPQPVVTNACVECIDDDTIPEEDKLPPSMKCRSCENALLCESHAGLHRARRHKLESLDASAVPTRSFCPKHPTLELSHVCLGDNMVICVECVAYDHPIASHEVVRLEDSVGPVLASRLSSLRQKCVDGVSTLTRARDHVSNLKASLVAGTESSIAEVEKLVAALKVHLDAHIYLSVREVREICADRVKVLTAQLSELNVSIEQLKMGVVLCDGDSATSVMETGRRVEGVSALSALSGVSTSPVALDCVSILLNLQELGGSISNSCFIRLAGLNGAESSVEGSGVVSFACGEDVLNTFRLRCVDTDGLPMERVSVSDVSLVIRGVDTGGVAVPNGLGDIATVGQLVSCVCVEGVVGVFDVAYVVEGDIPVIQLELRVCGVLVTGKCVVVPQLTGYAGGKRLVRSLELVESDFRALVVSPDEKWLVVASRSEQGVFVYSLPDAASVLLMHRSGSGPGEFHDPAGLSWSPLSDSNFLVCDTGNDRVQELALSGEYVRSIPCARALSIDANRDVLVVGCGEGSSSGIRIFETLSGAFLREFGTVGVGVEYHIPGGCCGIQLTRDGLHLVTCDGSNRIFQFAVDGSSSRCVSLKVDLCDDSDVTLTCGGDLVAVSGENRSVYIFSWATGELLRTVGEGSNGEGQFMYPTACTVAGDRLYVLDNRFGGQWLPHHMRSAPRVLVFE